MQQPYCCSQQAYTATRLSLVAAVAALELPWLLFTYLACTQLSYATAVSSAAEARVAASF